MIPFFPTPYPEEMFYSIGGRFADSLGLIKGKSAVQMLLGSQISIVPIDLPTNLAHLVSQFPPHYPITTEILIRDHTSMSYYAPFLSSTRFEFLLSKMTVGDGESIKTHLGLSGSRIPTNLRYCPECLQEQRSRFGKGYWLRWMQVTSIFCCPIHHVSLIMSDVRISNRTARHNFITLESIKNTLVNISPDLLDEDSKLMRLALDTVWLFQNGWEFRGIGDINQRYHKLLYERGYCTYSGNLYVLDLINAFEAYYTTPFLRKLNCSLTGSNDSWLIRLTHTTDHFKNPLHHLLMIHFLGYRVDEFLTIDPTKTPFGKGPWPCLNKVCENNRKLTIPECEIRTAKMKCEPIGTFKCPVCQFTYVRKGPDKLLEDREKRGRIAQYGEIWDSILRELWGNLEISMNGITKELGVCQSAIENQAYRLNLPFPRPGNRLRKDIQAPQIFPPIEKGLLEKIIEKRKAWVSLRKTHPQLSASELRSLHPGLYQWLSRNDKEWFAENKPVFKQKTRSEQVIDWETKDIDIAICLLKGSLSLTEGVPKRLTKSAFYRESRVQHVLEKRQERIPVSSGIITRLIESQIEIAVRRIWYLTWDSYTKNKFVSRNLFIERTLDSLQKEPIISQTISQAIAWIDSMEIVENRSDDQLKKLHKIFLIINKNYPQG